MSITRLSIKARQRLEQVQSAGNDLTLQQLAELWGIDSPMTYLNAQVPRHLWAGNKDPEGVTRIHFNFDAPDDTPEPQETAEPSPHPDITPVSIAHIKDKIARVYKEALPERYALQYTPHTDLREQNANWNAAKQRGRIDILVREEGQKQPCLSFVLWLDNTHVISMTCTVL